MILTTNPTILKPICKLSYSYASALSINSLPIAIIYLGDIMNIAHDTLLSISINGSTNAIFYALPIRKKKNLCNHLPVCLAGK